MGSERSIMQREQAHRRPGSASFILRSSLFTRVGKTQPRFRAPFRLRGPPQIL
jgi:hypothetical protein